MDEIEISTDKNRLNIHFISEFISNSYWAKGRTKETMQTCIDNSLNFGVYLHDRQVGFARVVTDYGQFAYIMDLFIQENCRGNGYSKKLIEFILEFDKLKNIKIWRLATSDAHGLYKQFGFSKIAKPENLMELLK
ncbi:GNAT family N-acetyltransferase [Algoriphagus sp. A40]|uniref:GNAT family N-acetyltransferase n=1 Tax=Algoriphagus sp. A40 TaxID=1945863 RepID=UPI000986C197|nr:GNAT family N-acetyltransferase [Algoriphagus sp. A40]OOG77619.1 GNAT family N-acetyltransferase [Algoriphagus sp. A40]